MKILFIADPLDSFKLAKDSTYAMMVEAAKRGHELYFTPQEGLMWKGGRVLCVNNVLPPMGDTSCGGTKLLDLLMMVSLPGRERTEAEWRALYGAADSDTTPQLTNIKGTPGVEAVINCGFGQGPAIVPRLASAAGPSSVPAVLRWWNC